MEYSRCLEKDIYHQLDKKHSFNKQGKSLNFSVRYIFTSAIKLSHQNQETNLQTPINYIVKRCSTNTFPKDT